VDFRVDHLKVWQEAPDDCSGAMEFGNERCKNEVSAANGAQVEDCLRWVA
jgi:hypothetical protein